jgi:hypothetical protein
MTDKDAGSKARIWPSPEEMEKQRVRFTQHTQRLASIQDRGYDIRQDAIIASALIDYLFGPTGEDERNAFDLFATSYYGKALNEIEAKIIELQEQQKQEYIRQQLLSGAKKGELRFPTRKVKDNPQA